MNPSPTRFLGIAVPEGLTRINFVSMYLATLMAGLMMTVTALVYPVFLVDEIGIDQTYAGTINGLLHMVSQGTTLLLVAYLGMISDKAGRKVLIFGGFVVMAISWLLISASADIGAALGIPETAAAVITATLSLVPADASIFAPFASRLLVMYLLCLCLSLGLVASFPQFVIVVADYTSEKDRGKGMAMNGIMIGSSGLIVFIGLAPLMARIGAAHLMLLLAAVAAVGAATTWLFLKDRPGLGHRHDARLLDVIHMARARMPIRASYLVALAIRADIAVIATFLISWGVKYGTAQGLSAEAASLRSSYAMIVLAASSFLVFPVIGVLLDRVGRIPVILAALIASTIGMMLLAIVPTPFHPLVFVSAALIGIGMSGAIAGPNALAADAAPAGETGAVLGGLNTMAPLGTLIFLGAGGYLFDRFGPGWAFAAKGGATALIALWLTLRRGDIEAAIKQGSA